MTVKFLDSFFLFYIMLFLYFWNSRLTHCDIFLDIVHTTSSLFEQKKSQFFPLMYFCFLQPSLLFFCENNENPKIAKVFPNGHSEELYWSSPIFFPWDFRALLIVWQLFFYNALWQKGLKSKKIFWVKFKIFLVPKVVIS